MTVIFLASIFSINTATTTTAVVQCSAVTFDHPRRASLGHLSIGHRPSTDATDLHTLLECLLNKGSLRMPLYTPSYAAPFHVLIN